ncbi:MAG: DUF1186 domain-containing protein [Anaerolineae bacterium]|nr:DUF1186 domain-containing protein [Anaerolineae bacterium]
MNSQTIDYFETLSASDILQETPAKWGDSDLLDVLGLFEELNDSERETAVLELILTSPDNNDEMIDYAELYFELIQNSYISQKKFDKAIYWLLAALAYEFQHDTYTHTVQNLQRSLAEVYLRQGNYDVGLQIFTRLLQADPGDLWTHNMMALVFPDVNLQSLAIPALERALELAKDNDPEQLSNQLQDFYNVLTEKEETPPLPDINPDILAEFHKTLALAPLPEDTQPEKHLPPITDLLNQGETLDNTLHETILAQWKVFVPELLQVAFDEDYWGTAVNRHTISLLRQIHKTEPALDSLTQWLDQATDKNWPQLLCQHTGKIGGFTTPELKSLIANTELDTFIRSAASEDLLTRLEKISEQRSEPEQRSDIIEFCRTLLTRKDAYEAQEELFIALLIDNISDTNAKELYPEIKQAFDEDRLDPTITDLPYINEKWDMTPLPPAEIREDGLYVTLACKKCQRTRRYFVQHVTIDMTTLAADLKDQNVPYDPHIMDRPIVCPKCGAIDQYKTDPITSMRLAMGSNPENIFSKLMGEEPATTSTPDPFVSQVRPQAFGQNMHPLVALNKYKQIALNHPKNAEPHWRMGNILRMIWRDEQAREAYKRSIELDPKELYSYYCLATTEHDLGNFDEAQILYQKTMKLISPMEMMSDEELMSISMSAAEGLKALENGLPSPYAQEYRIPKEEPKLNRKERRAQKKRMRKMNKKKRH